MGLNSLIFLAINSSLISLSFAAVMLTLAFARLLPLNLQLTIGKGFADLSRYIAASKYQIKSTEADPIRIDPINWYGRGNVMYQIGQILTEADIITQRQRSNKALQRLQDLRS